MPFLGRILSNTHRSAVFRNCVLGAALAAGFSQSAEATYVPSVKIGTAALISPLSADTYYNSQGANLSTDGLSALNGGTAATPVAPEIVELTLALKNDPDLIYQYVHNNIQTTWIYGLHKGALGTEIDKAGTPFDQAELMVALLRQAGYSPSYVAGTIYLDQTQFYNWTGITKALAACQLLSSGGIPAQVNDNAASTTCSTYSSGTAITHVRMAHIWVKVTLSGTDYVFDPSYKVSTWKAGIDLPTATGLVHGDPLSAATSGMSSGNRTSGSVNVPYVNTLNASQLNTKLQTYSTNLLSYIQAHHLQGAQIEDIVSGGVIVPVNTSVRQTALPYADPTPPYTAHVWTSGTRYNAIPDQYRTTLEVQGKSLEYDSVSGPTHDVTMFDATFYADEIYGRQLMIDTDFRASGISNQTDFQHNYAKLLLDGNGFSSLPAYQYHLPSDFGQATARGLAAHVLLTVSHPYAATDGTTTASGGYMDRTIDKPVVLITPIAIVNGWGEASEAMHAKWSDEQASDQPLPPEFVWPDCPGQPDQPCPNLQQQPTGNLEREKIAASWLAQFSRATKLNAAVANAVPAVHDVLGFVYGDNAPLNAVYNKGVSGHLPDFVEADNFNRLDVDAALSLTIKTSDTSSSATRRSALGSIAATGATLEGSMASQTADAPDTSSTATRFEWNNAPDTDHSAFGQNPVGLGPQDFLKFDSSDVSAAAALVQVDGLTSTTSDGRSGISAPPVIGSSELEARRSALSTEIGSYVSNGFTVYAAREAFLGPGQRGGIFLPETPASFYSHWASKQRGGTFVAVKTDGNGDPVEIAHVLIGVSSNPDGSFFATKGGGGGDQPDNHTSYDPAQAADILKSRFVDRSNALGVNLAIGSLAYSSPVSLSVGNGGFPYELSASTAWHAGIPPAESFAPTPPTDPVPGWTHNWLNKLALSGSGNEALGTSDIRGAAGAIVSFLAGQDIYNSTPSTEREAAALLAQAWWAHQLTDNVASVSVGASTTQFVQIADGTWIAPGTGFAKLVQSAPRTPEEYKCSNALHPPPYAMSRGWKDEDVSFDVTGAHGDVQHFGYWENDYPVTDANNCGRAKGFRMTAWTSPQGGGSAGVTLTYANSGAHTLDMLTKVQNGIGRELDFSGTTISTGTGGRQITLDTATHTDARGNATTFAFVGPLAQSTTQRPVPYKLLSAVTTPETPTKHNVEYTYDALGRVDTVKDAVAIQKATRGPYQFLLADGTRGERDDPLGQAYTVVYDTYAHPSRYIDEMGIETDALVDSRGRTVNTTYPEGDCEAFAYDDRNNTTDFWKVDKVSNCIILSGPTHVLHASAVWDPAWNKPTSVTNFRGKTTTLSYYASGNGKSLLYQATRPAIPEGTPVYTFTYTALGKVDTATNPAGIVTKNNYDVSGNGNLVSTVVDNGGLALTTGFGYDSDGNVTSTTDPLGYVTTAHFDANRNKDHQEHHDGNGTAPMNAATQTVYDEINRPTEGDVAKCFDTATPCLNHGTTVATWIAAKKTTYTPTSKVATVTDADNRTTTTTYDDGDRTLMLTDPVGRKTRFAYCTLGNTDCAANQVKTEWRAWVSGGGCSSGTSLQECYRRVTYWPDGQQKTLKDANGNTTSYAYDGFDRPYQTTFPDSTAETIPLSGGYDENGNILQHINRAGTALSYTYDDLDEMRTKTMPQPPSANLVTTWTYLLDGRVDTLSDTSSASMDYGYDGAGRMTQVINHINGFGANRTVNYTLDANGNRTKLTWPTNDVSNYYVGYCYDSLNRMTAAMESSTSSGCATNLLATYSYDAQSRRTNLTYAGSGAQMQYTSYSDAGDLKTLAHALNDANSNTFNWLYTNAHQTNSFDASNTAWLWRPSANSATSYTVNNLNQYSTVNSTAQSYDLNGNLTGDGTYTFTYDAENRLLTASKTGLAATYAYDPLGRRTKKSGTGVTTTYYLSDGTDEIAEYDSAKTVVTRIVPGPAIDEPIAIQNVSTGAKAFFHTDKQGSVVAMSDASGALAEGPYIYDPYGNCFSGGSPCSSAGEPYRYTGRRWDPEIGCYYYRARYYCADDKHGGRFLQTDPVGYTADLDLYTYGNNDPLNCIDPLGKTCQRIGGTVTCTIPGSRIKISFPAPKGWPEHIRPGDRYYHKYDTQYEDKRGSRTPASEKQNRARMDSEAIQDNPTPGVDQPATPGGTLNDAQPIPGLPYGASPVTSYSGKLADGTTLTVNATRDDHPLGYGYVARFVEITKDGRVVVHNVGEGVGFLQSDSSPSPIRNAINGVWSSTTEATLNAMDEN